MTSALFPVLYDQPADRPEPRVQLFLSHDHDDVALATALVTALEVAFEVPAGAIRATSVAGYRLEIGAKTGDTLRQELSGALVVIALLTERSVHAPWVIFECGAAWALRLPVLPLLGVGVTEALVPGALRETIAGRLDDPYMGGQLLDQLGRLLGWAQGNRAAALAMLGRMP
jgi:hypothetical protein